MVGRLTLPPLIDTPYKPNEIIRPDELQLLTRHCEKWANGKQGDLSKADRDQAAKLLDHLQRFGYKPNGFYKGRIVWARLLKSQIQQVMEDGE